MKRIRIGFILCLLLSFIFVITSFIGGGFIIATLFNIPLYLGITSFSAVFVILSIITFLLIKTDE